MTNDERKVIAESMKNSSSEDEFLLNLQKYIFSRLDLPDGTREENLYYLVLYSVRLKMPNEDISTLESRLATVDCHQTSYIVSKKTLLMMEIENETGTHISADEAADIENIKQYAHALWRTKNENK